MDYSSANEAVIKETTRKQSNRHDRSFHFRWSCLTSLIILVPCWFVPGKSLMGKEEGLYQTTDVIQLHQHDAATTTLLPKNTLHLSQIVSPSPKPLNRTVLIDLFQKRRATSKKAQTPQSTTQLRQDIILSVGRLTKRTNPGHVRRKNQSTFSWNNRNNESRGNYHDFGGGGYQPPDKQSPPKYSDCNDDVQGGASGASCEGYGTVTPASSGVTAPSSVPNYPIAAAIPQPVRPPPLPPTTPLAPTTLPLASPAPSYPTVAFSPPAPTEYSRPPSRPRKPFAPIISESPSIISPAPLHFSLVTPTSSHAPFYESGSNGPGTTSQPTGNARLPPTNSSSSPPIGTIAPTLVSRPVGVTPLAVPPSFSRSPFAGAAPAPAPGERSATPTTSAIPASAPKGVSNTLTAPPTIVPSSIQDTESTSTIQLKVEVLQTSVVQFNVSQFIAGVINNILNSSTPFRTYPSSVTVSSNKPRRSKTKIFLVQDLNASDVKVQGFLSSTTSWRLYTVGYRCFDATNNNTPIVNATVLQKIYSTCQRALNASIVSGSFLRQLAAVTNQSHVNVLNVSELGGPTMNPSASPSVAPSTAPSLTPTIGPSAAPSVQPSTSPSSVPSTSPSALPSSKPSTAPSLSPSHAPSATPSLLRYLPGARTYPLPLSTKAFDVRWWVGLGIAVATICSTVLLTYLGAQREEKLKQEELWGFQLGTEQDVGALLNLGFMWQQGEGHEGPPKGVIVFEKDKVGYRDEDSMLMGGYHDPHYVMNTAEVTLPSSGTSRDRT